MEKSELKTGQLLDIKEKRGKLVQEYVAGFFGDEPIVKQRLLTPQEARRYREDLQRAKKEGKTSSEAASEAGAKRSVPTPGGRLARRAKPEESGSSVPTVRRKIKKVRAPRKDGVSPRAQEPLVDTPAEAATTAAPAMAYIPEQSDSVAEFIKTIVDNEQEKPNYDANNTQKAMDAIRRISCPEMKIYRLGTGSGDDEGESYTQKEYIARNILGLPIWKPKPKLTEQAESKPEEEAVSAPPIPTVESGTSGDEAIVSNEEQQASEQATEVLDA